MAFLRSCSLVGLSHFSFVFRFGALIGAIVGIGLSVWILESYGTGRIIDLFGHAGAPASAKISTVIAAAWARRNATVIRPISSAIGSRPKNTPR